MIWYEDEVKRVEQEKSKLAYEPKTIFYGSSSIRLWNDLYEDFKDFYPINLGFGGSTLAACVWFFERILTGYQPERIVFYAGDNDLGDGRNPEEIFIFFQQLAVQVNNRFPTTSFYFISVKPSPARWHMIDKIRYTNALVKGVIDKQGAPFHYVSIVEGMLGKAGLPVKDLFLEDGLHLSDKGYVVWKELLLEYLAQNP
ncbi:GDSL family lipase [Pseudoflavitalea sp. X16]|uniref:GDSL-type esterase/lipase family protein n=1 Tax=Paraflavitalea devenefica TaxID=2716334 RepID=UPI0014237013|nr:GDSL-type esterase/lipase family protein [Paraflavitalea devenefica]NII28789.1 GDSL family lipase [Paraflavitalea devenefica]